MDSFATLSLVAGYDLTDVRNFIGPDKFQVVEQQIRDIVQVDGLAGRVDQLERAKRTSEAKMPGFEGQIKQLMVSNEQLKKSLVKLESQNDVLRKSLENALENFRKSTEAYSAENSRLKTNQNRQGESVTNSFKTMEASILEIREKCLSLNQEWSNKWQNQSEINELSRVEKLTLSEKCSNVEKRVQFNAQRIESQDDESIKLRELVELSSARTLQQISDLKSDLYEKGSNISKSENQIAELFGCTLDTVKFLVENIAH